jgi:hypothetical protein
MVLPCRNRLNGEVEVDETFIGGVKSGKRGRGAAGKAMAHGHPSRFREQGYAIFTALAELSTRQIAETAAATGMTENKTASRTGGRIARRARLELEAQTGQKVVTSDNFLPPPEIKKALPPAND